MQKFKKKLFLLVEFKSATFFTSIWCIFAIYFQTKRKEIELPGNDVKSCNLQITFQYIL